MLYITIVVIAKYSIVYLSVAVIYYNFYALNYEEIIKSYK